MNKNKKMAIELYSQGIVSHREWAEALNISVQATYRWLEDDEFVQALKKIDDDVMRENKKLLSKKAIKAIQALENVIDNSRNDLARVSAAKEILDRTGYEAEAKLNIDGVSPVQIINDIPRGEGDA